MSAVLVVLAVVLVVSSLGVHELGHWVAMRRAGLPVQYVSFGAGPVLIRTSRVAVRLFPIAVSLHFEREPWRMLKPQQRFFIAVAGPAMNLINAGALAAVALLEQSGGLMLLAQLNLGLALVNLLPFPPFDGWHALCAAVEQWSNQAIPQRFEAVADRLGNAFVGGVGALVILKLLTAGKSFFS